MLTLFKEILRFLKKEHANGFLLEEIPFKEIPFEDISFKEIPFFLPLTLYLPLLYFYIYGA